MRYGHPTDETTRTQKVIAVLRGMRKLRLEIHPGQELTTSAFGGPHAYNDSWSIGL